MRKNRFWIELVMLCVGMACALALLLACLGTVGAAAGEPTAEAATSSTAVREAHSESQQPVAPVPQEVQLASEPAQPGPEQAYEGMVSCSQCEARHSPAFGKTAASCSRACVHGGSQFALVEGDKTYLLDGDMTLVKKYAGQRVKLVGALTGRTIVVSSVAAAS